MSLRQQKLVQEDFERRLAESDGTLFTEINAQMIAVDFVVPPMPLVLEPFSENATNAGIKEDAAAIFVVWLRKQRETMGAHHFTSSGIANEVPCAKPDVIDAFLPEYPYAEDFELGTADEEFQKAFAVAEIEMAVAKQVCRTECTLRLQCLARSIKADGDYPSMEVEPWIVAGGWGPLAREAVARGFHELRRNYLNDRMPADEREDYEAQVSMLTVA